MAGGTAPPLLALALIAGIAALATAALIHFLEPWVKRYALARPNARSSHQEPTPQGGGAAVVLSTLILIWLCASHYGLLTGEQALAFTLLTAAIVILAIIGAIDDVRGLPAAPRFVLQCFAVALVIAGLPGDWLLWPVLPSWLERGLLVLAVVWFVNLTNFMDGIDWITVAEIVPITGAVVLFASLGVVDPLYGCAAAALLGGMLGFAPFNKPVARLFLGDVGSLPIGLLVALLLLQLAYRGHWAAALLLPLYYLADATLTLLRRLIAGERVWQAHRTHFYQRATAGGYTVGDVVARIGATNVALVALAYLSIALPGTGVAAATLAAGAVLVGILLAAFARGRKP
jgi:UDP-N-acetylmuramyl pentapeptide phosphotransferase/UDP-N-acetylglucosamine-1-phosphate transferase